jgi:hypothetical protein
LKEKPLPSSNVVVFVFLEGEGVPVWRPVIAVPLGQDKFQLADQKIENEKWQFPPGSVVRCEHRHHSGEITLVAVELASN